MNKSICFIVFCLINYISLSKDWQIINSGTTNNLRIIEQTSSSNLLIGGFNGTLISSQNIGKSWSKIDSFGKTNFISIYFLDSLNGWIGGQKPPNSNELLFYTEDGGKNWINKEIAGINSVTSIIFIDDNNGFLTADNGEIFKTTNSGIDWINLTRISGYPHDIKFFSKQSGLIACKNGILYKSNDYGNSWSIININTTTTLGKIFVIDSNNIFISGYNGSIFHSTDFGENWKETKIVDNLPIFSINFKNQFGVLCGGWNSNGFAFTTNDNGVNWKQETLPVNYDLFSSSIISSDNILFVGNNGIILNLLNNTDIIDNRIFNLYPNPGTDEVRIDLNNVIPAKAGIQDLNVKVYNIHGVEVLKPTTPSLRDTPPYQGGESITIDVSGLAPGLYFVQVGDKMYKFVKM